MKIRRVCSRRAPIDISTAMSRYFSIAFQRNSARANTVHLNLNRLPVGQTWTDDRFLSSVHHSSFCEGRQTTKAGCPRGGPRRQGTIQSSPNIRLFRRFANRLRLNSLWECSLEGDGLSHLSEQYCG